jgi:hypothetical protein
MPKRIFPGEQLQMTVDLVAPKNPGKYRFSYFLSTIPDNAQNAEPQKLSSVVTVDICVEERNAETQFLADLLNIPAAAQPAPANINLLNLVSMPPQQNNNNVRATVIDGPVDLGN